jgi:hypothetical protein
VAYYEWWMQQPNGSVLLEARFPRDVQRVKLKQKEEQQRSSGASIVKKPRKELSIDI